MIDDQYKDFRQAVQRPEKSIDLGRAALAMAASDYPDLDIAGYLSRIDELAAMVAARLGADADVYQSIAALNVVLFKEHGFRGNREHYFDPRNSFLNEVLDRRTGIPISLSVLYIEVAQKIGVALQGVGFPGHFLVKVLGGREDIVLDPFNQGEIVSQRRLETMLERLYDGKIAFDPVLVQPVGKKQILRRMLNNLKLIYARQNDWIKGLTVVERLVVLDPGSGEDIRDRGLICLQLERFKQAQEDLESYLRLVPHAADADAVRERVKVLTRQIH